MTNERHSHYKSAKRQIESMTTKLHADERHILDDAAEGLLLSYEPEGDEAQELLADARAQLDTLVEADRWLSETADKLFAELEGCAVAREVALA
jgi:hypothetical protein